MWSNEHFGRHSLTCFQNAWTVVMKLITVTHDTDDILKVVGSKVKVTDNVSENALSGRGILISGPLKTIQLVYAVVDCWIMQTDCCICSGGNL